MPSSRPARRFDDIIVNIRSILQDVEGMTGADFAGDRLVQDAVLYRLLRISEAAKKLGAAAKSMAPDQPWDQIRAFGNAIRHDYDEIRLDQVWIIVRRDLPGLMSDCERAVAAIEAEESRLCRKK